MANENERHADIIAKMRNEGHTGPADALEWVREKMTYYADLLEAAHKREVDEIQAQIDELRLGIEQYRQYNARVVKECNGKLGNTAKLREALSKVIFIYGPAGHNILGKAMRDIIYAAFSAPPRNCDIYATYEDALIAWRHEPPNGQTFHEWMFSTAKEGAAK